ncbi:SGNH/GDSL hydrolase family protein [Mucilaginibacter sp. PAMB04168]|uniref:SGNH/GDSL hydrolase family protein n=1 Tax=Mucilaginibacter sp. PAMB04168 TaxID=3138567 RepID=UPI0033260A6F
MLLATACKKDSLTNEFADDNATVNVPSNPLDIDPGKIIDTTKRIVIIGSSTAAGFGASVADSCWAGRLNAKLVRDKKPFKLINLGKGGYTTFQLMQTGSSPASIRPKPDTNRNVTAALKYNPSLVIINLPTNDIALNFRDEEIISNYRNIIGQIAAKRIEFIITSTQPRNFQLLDQRKRIKILNDKVLAMFPGHVDDYLRKLSSPTWSILKYYSAGDGIHLNNNGHRVIYQTLVDFPIFKTVVGY